MQIRRSVFANIANGDFVTAEVPATTYSVDIVPTGGTTPIFGPRGHAAGRSLNWVFAIGYPEDGTMDAIVQGLPLSQEATRAPTSVRAGSAGLLLAPGDLPWSNAGVAGFGR